MFSPCCWKPVCMYVCVCVCMCVWLSVAPILQTRMPCAVGCVHTPCVYACEHIYSCELQCQHGSRGEMMHHVWRRDKAEGKKWGWMIVGTRPKTNGLCCELDLNWITEATKLKQKPPFRKPEAHFLFVLWLISAAKQVTDSQRVTATSNTRQFQNVISLSSYIS